MNSKVHLSLITLIYLLVGRYIMIKFTDEIDEIHKPNTIGELVILTRKIVNEKRYLLIENKDEQPILVDIRTANTFNIGVDLISDRQYNRLNEYFEQYLLVLCKHDRIGCKFINSVDH